MLYSYNWLKWYIPEALDPEKLADVLTYHLAEVENVEHRVFNNEEDLIFDIKILPNRAHDLLSHQGLARELASLNGCRETPGAIYIWPPLLLMALLLQLYRL